MANALNEVYEPRFLDCSYGFRPGRSAHDVVRYINKTIMTHKVNYVMEADIKGFFDKVDHERLIKFLAHDIQDKNFLRHIKRILIAGIMEETDLKDSDRGTPQGGSISPVLANGGEGEAGAAVIGHHLCLTECRAQRLLHGIGERLARRSLPL